MRFIPGCDEEGTIDLYQVADGCGTLSISNERGDCIASIRRPDGSLGMAYGGPVYDLDEFRNICMHLPPRFAADDWVCAHEHDMTAAELTVATALARKVGWFQ